MSARSADTFTKATNCPTTSSARSASTARRISNRSNKKEKKMKIRYNQDEEIVKIVKEGLERTGGYCPCRRERTADTKCMCKEFRDQIKDPDYEGYCHCMLYYKEK
ncbi:MAG: hypothetical protein II534_04080 [Clostridia bacterium]|nr:hypothetical protein [Clostridia bacterium]